MFAVLEATYVKAVVGETFLRATLVLDDGHLFTVDLLTEEPVSLVVGKRIRITPKTFKVRGVEPLEYFQVVL